LVVLEERAGDAPPARHLGQKRAHAVPELAALDAAAHDEARALAVLLHLAGALAAAGAERVTAAVVREQNARICLAGAIDPSGGLGRRSAALWRETFAAELTLVQADDARKVAGLRYDMPLAQAARRILAAQLTRLTESIDGLRNDADVEALHDARVAARRMRTAFQLLDDAFPPREARPLVKGLRGLASALGGVRDLDVLIERVRDDAREHAEEAALAPVLIRMDERRVQARRALLARLDSPEHAAWLQALRTFLDGVSRGHKGDRRVCDTVPTLLWRRYGRVRAYAPELTSASDARLHELRKDVRRLRYALEFFQELLGDETATLLRRAVELQDALGALHDTVVLRETLERYHAPEPAAARALAALARRRAEALDGWPHLTDGNCRAALGAACAAL
jgi:CHAD domain-containing protein